MPKESTLTLTLKVDDQGTVVLDKFSKSIQKAGDDVSKMSKAMEVVSVSAFINIAQQAVGAANKIYDFGRAIASAGNDIQRQSRVFNMSTDDLQRWSYATKMADVDIEGFGQGFKFLTRSMGEALQGSGDALKAFNALGISLKDATGKTKDQQTVMMEVIGTLEKFADGVNRDALMLAIFGRGWMSFKPLVDQGTGAIKDNMEQAEKMGLVLGKDLTKALSDAENIYKKWEATFQASKVQFWAPMVETMTKFLDVILKIKSAMSGKWQFQSDEEGAKKVYEYLKKVGQLPPPGERGAYEEIFKTFGEEGGVPDWVKEWVKGYEPGAGKKPEAPGIGGKYAGPTKEDILSGWEAAVQKSEELYQIWRANNEEWSLTIQQVDKLDTDMAKTVAEAEELSRLGKMPDWRESLEDLPKGFMKINDTIMSIQDYMSALYVEAPQWIKDWVNATNQLESVVKTFGENLSSVWANSVSNMIKGAQSFSDGVKNIFKGIGDAFISTVTKMITQWLLFGSITGKKEEKAGFFTGGSWGGLIGSISSIFSALQEGGLVTRPTPALIGEAGPEAVIPLKSGKIPIEGGKDAGYQVINYIQVYDPQNYQRLYAPIIRKISEQSIADVKRYNKSSGRNM